jgi:hypothetical protein
MFRILLLFSLLGCARTGISPAKSAVMGRSALQVMETGQVHWRLNEIPAGIFRYIDRVEDLSIHFAERDMPFQKSDGKDRYIPDTSRRLIAAWQLGREWVLMYERGGRSYRCMIAWFYLKNERVSGAFSLTLRYPQLPADYHDIRQSKQLLAAQSYFLLYVQGRRLRRTAYF